MSERKLSRRDFLNLAAAATAGSLLAACGVAPTPEKVVETVVVEVEKEVEKVVTATPAGRQSVELWTGYGQGAIVDIMDTVFEQFEDTHPNLEINHIVVPWGELHNKVIASTAAGNPPDAYRGWSWIIGEDAPLGALTPLDVWIDAVPDFNKEDIYPAVLNQMRYRGQTYGTSHSTMVEVMVHNNDVLREAGVDPENLPDTIDALGNRGPRQARCDRG